MALSAHAVYRSHYSAWADEVMPTLRFWRRKSKRKNQSQSKIKKYRLPLTKSRAPEGKHAGMMEFYAAAIVLALDFFLCCFAPSEGI